MQFREKEGALNRRAAQKRTETSARPARPIPTLGEKVEEAGALEGARIEARRKASVIPNLRKDLAEAQDDLRDAMAELNKPRRDRDGMDVAPFTEEQIQRYIGPMEAAVKEAQQALEKAIWDERVERAKKNKASGR